MACAGWLVSFGHLSLPVRVSTAMGRLDVLALTAGPNWPPLYETWDEMVAGQMWLPGMPEDHIN